MIIIDIPMPRVIFITLIYIIFTMLYLFFLKKLGVLEVLFGGENERKN